MTKTTELRKRFDDNFISHPHEDDDVGTCASHYSVCSKCRKESYYLNLEKCRCKAPRIQKPCTCGADEIKEEQFEWLLSEIEAAEKAKEEQFKENIKWVKPSEMLPPISTLVWIKRLNSDGAKQVYIGMRSGAPLSTNPDPSRECHWYGNLASAGLFGEVPWELQFRSNFSDVTVDGWAFIAYPTNPIA